MSVVVTSPRRLAPAAPDVAPSGLSERRVRAWQVLDSVLDPEVPALSVCDLGLVRAIDEWPDSDLLEVVLTPTYSGCPATELITQDVLAALETAGLGPARVVMQRAPAWSSDWISAAGRLKLRNYGIAPPGPATAVPIRWHHRLPAPALQCPRCDSLHTEQLAAFGATACKALHRCLACGEPFEYFKPI